MQRIAAGLACALLICACQAEQPNHNTSEPEKATSIIKCVSQGTSVLRDRQGVKSDPVRSTTFYRIDASHQKIEAYDTEKSAFSTACPPDRKCEIRVGPSRIEIAHQLADPEGMVATGRIDIDRVTGDIRTVNDISWPLSGRSVSSTTAGTCEPSTVPTSKF